MFFGKSFRRSETPWEVIASEAVNPVPMWDEDDELDVVRMHSMDMSFKSVYDIHQGADLGKALQWARLQLMQEARLKKCNIMITEGWQLTLMRKGKKYRAEVVYTGRPAYSMGKIRSLPPPPFMAMLDHCQRQLPVAPRV